MLRCGFVVFSRAWLEGSVAKPVHTIFSISSGVNLVWSFCSTTYNGDDKHLSLWLAHNIAGWQTSKFLITLAGLRNCSFFNRACWLKPVTHDRWLGILFPESLAS